jgi:hypothetical protein
LRDQQPVERVTVMRGQCEKRLGMLVRNSQRT